ncbi:MULTISPECIES: LysR family transcriptional regulator [unclassified Methylobacterium]|uniref:LysR family transcriptional regulator n=1 Tax=unclassified Methylobacterium TaxID=2615210 RepID=UPI0011C202AB|nr:MULTISPECIES: LysR family transcriptional regulator [unclassified Methylobacterium]QEE42387.1 LysR family transcriptional regulator [Methylobacterium sp. WL1]TXN59668.1 LysR family transcriptional regulator [Methylobacterium sp. WL2]
MATLKQFEALRWIALLGSFERAADRLNTTQSSVSKRIHELEASLGTPLFDRSQRGARLTEKGKSILAIGEEMLALRDRAVAVATSRTTLIRHLRFGVTELTALTWLPQLVAELRATYPNIVLEPEVEQSTTLFDNLKSGALDFIVTPDVFRQPGFRSVALASVRSAWMCSPVLLRDRGVVELAELAQFSILTQGNRSGSGVVFDQWLHACGVSLPHMIQSNSFVAIVGLTLAEVGISYLPERCFDGLIERERLRVVETNPPLPPITYVVTFRETESFNTTESIARIAQSTCNFTRPIQWA